MYMYLCPLLFVYSVRIHVACDSLFVFYFLQILQAADKNYDTSGKKQVWKCESSRLDQLLKCTLHLFCTYILYMYSTCIF